MMKQTYKLGTWAALDAALNDVAIYRRAAFWFAVSSLLAVGVAVASF